LLPWGSDESCNGYDPIQAVTNQNVLKSIPQRKLYHALMKSIRETHGMIAVGDLQSSMQLKSLSAIGYALIRIQRDKADLLAEALPFVRQVGSIPVSIRCVHVGGMSEG